MSTVSKKPQQHEKAVAFIVARLSSSRLPAKQLKNIGDKQILQWIIDSLRACRELDQVVIATVAEEENLPLKQYAEEQGIPCFWYQGDVDHVTTRLRCAAEEYQADICLLISGDCPLIHGPTIDLLIEEFRQTPEAENLTILPDENNQQHALEGVLISRQAAWQRADRLADRPELKEHQFPLLWMQPERFRHHGCHLPADLYAPRHRFSVDTWADLEFMNILHERLAKHGKAFRLPEALELLRKEPELLAINNHVHQRKLVDDEHKALFVVDAGGTYGFGHLMRSLELARQLTERKGWPVTFAVDDDQAERFLRQQGKKTVRASFARPLRADKAPDTASIQELSATYSLLVLDIYDQRGAEEGWREQLKAGLPVAVIDNRRPWAAAADLIITPGVTAAEDTGQAEKNRQPQQLSGADYLILRREILRLQESVTEKTLDLLVYLHDEQQRRQFAEYADQHKLTAKIVSQFCLELPQLMSAAKIYVSGFGISFYEALALGTLPVCCPDSAAHREDALRFYRHFAIEPLLIETQGAVAKTLTPLLAGLQLTVPRCTDGTPAIVAALTELVNGASA